MKIVPFFRLCSMHLLPVIEIHFAVHKFVMSHNNESFIELACLVHIGKVLVSFFLWKFMDLAFGLVYVLPQFYVQLNA